MYKNIGCNICSKFHMSCGETRHMKYASVGVLFSKQYFTPIRI